MIETMVAGFVTVVSLAVVGLFLAGFCALVWLVVLPFQLLGWVFKGLGLLFAVPFILLFGALGLLIFGIGMSIFLIPFIPLALIAWLLWRWMRRQPRATASA